MTDTGDLKVDGTVSATALEYDDNGTTKNVATELATLRSMIGSSGVSVAGMLTSYCVQENITVTLSSDTAPSSIHRPTLNRLTNYSPLSNWQRIISGGQVFECNIRYSVNSTKDSTPSAYVYSISSRNISDTVLSSIAANLASKLDVAGSFAVKCNFYAPQKYDPFFEAGTMKFRNGSYVGFTRTSSSSYDTLYSTESNQISIFAYADVSTMAPLED